MTRLSREYEWQCPYFTPMYRSLIQQTITSSYDSYVGNMYRTIVTSQPYPILEEMSVKLVMSRQ